MQRILLNVPFAEKDKAKSMGARWDAGLRTWWVTHEQAAAKNGLWKWVDGTSPTKRSRKEKREPAHLDRLIAKADKSKPKRTHFHGREKPTTIEHAGHSLIDCGCTYVAPWQDCGCGHELDADQAEHMRLIAAGS